MTYHFRNRLSGEFASRLGARHSLDRLKGAPSHGQRIRHAELNDNYGAELACVFPPSRCRTSGETKGVLL